MRCIQPPQGLRGGWRRRLQSWRCYMKLSVRLQNRTRRSCHAADAPVRAAGRDGVSGRAGGFPRWLLRFYRLTDADHPCNSCARENVRVALLTSGGQYAACQTGNETEKQLRQLAARQGIETVRRSIPAREHRVPDVQLWLNGLFSAAAAQEKRRRTSVSSMQAHSRRPAPMPRARCAAACCRVFVTAILPSA